jgi:ABC-type multidrug transport system fused ATPase/permease subunit
MAIKKKKRTKSFKILLKNIKRTIQLFWEIDRKGFVILIFLLSVTAVLPFATSYFGASNIDSLTSFLAGNDSARDLVIRFFIIFILLQATDTFASRTLDYYERVAYLKWHEKMAILVPEKISDLDLAKFENNKFNNFITKVNSGASHKPANYATNLLWSFHYLVSLISAVIVLFTLNPIFLPILTLTLIPGILVQMKFSKLAWGIWDTKGDENRLYGKTSAYLSDAGYIKEIKVFGIRQYLINRMEKLFNVFQAEQKQNMKDAYNKKFGTDLLEFATTIGIQVWMLLKVLARTPGFGIKEFLFYRNSIGSFNNSARRVVKQVNSLYENNLYMTDFFKLMDLESSIKSKENAVLIPTTTVPAIEFKDVSFKYPNSEEWIYKDFSIKINSGEDIALVGENGAGKTTFLKLLLRFYDIEQGEILVNGVNIKEIDLESWYKNIGILFQDFNKYCYNVEENIALGNIADFENKDKVIESSQKAGSHSFVQKYKKKYGQMLHKSFKNGVEPSGGQWQRIALARAFFRNANILILDEPTSAIDAKGEYEIFEKINKEQEKKTTIIISHRFSTVRNADKIYVIEHGKIIEEGAHEELMEINAGKYKEMFELQAEGYK